MKKTNWHGKPAKTTKNYLYCYTYTILLKKKTREIGGNVAGSMMHNSKYCNAMIRLNIIPNVQDLNLNPKSKSR